MALKTEQIIKILQLNGLGRRTAFQICDKSINDVIDNNQDLIEFLDSCITNKWIMRLTKYSKEEYNEAFGKADKIIEMSESEDIKLVSYYDNHYPKSLKFIKNPPIILNYKGDIKELNNINGVAIIGTKKPTIEGIKSGEYFGEVFGKKGFNVVSGLALGCDTAAHKGCLKVNGMTTAVLAHGLHTIYPKENKELADEIVYKGGVLLSEYFVGTGTLPNYFVERDRIQPGLSIATVVIQTGLKGGTMHAVNVTLESNKILSAVNYENKLISDMIKGNNMLIKEKNAFPLQSNNYSQLIDLIHNYLSLNN